jgi:hypothetical protein
MTARFMTSVFVAACLLISQLEMTAFAEEPGNGLRIAVVERHSDFAADRKSSEIVVQVFNEGAPEAGAKVVFSLPDSGPGGKFSNGKRRLTVQTDSQGQASSGSIRTNQIPGPYNVAVVASVASATAEAAIPQSNPAGAAPKKGGGKKWLWIVAAAAGAVVAILVVKRKKDPVVTVGAPTVGNPQ